MSKPFSIDRHRLTMALAIAVPVAIVLGIGLGELHWRSGGAVAIPEMCITAEADGETSVSLGNCEGEATMGI